MRLFAMRPSLLIAFLGLSLLGLSDASAADPVLYAQDFDGDVSFQKWSIKAADQWTVADGRLKATNTSDKPSVGCRGPRFSGKPAMRMSFRVDPQDTKNIAFKLNHPSGGHVWRLILTPRDYYVQINANRQIPITQPRALEHVPMDLKGDTWHDVTLTLRGDKVDVDVDGVAHSYQDEHFRHPLATFGLSIRGDSALFDDFRITEIAASDDAVAPVSKPRPKPSAVATTPMAKEPTETAPTMQPPTMQPPTAQPSPVRGDALLAVSKSRHPITRQAASFDLTMAEPTDLSKIRTMLAVSCADCHMDGAAEGNLDLDVLGDDLADAETLRRWVLMFDRIRDGEMPPPDYDTIEETGKQTLLTSLAATLHHADAAGQEVVLRRLNRLEYENTVNDLFGIAIDVDEEFPTDASRGGFDNNGEALTLSAELVETYLRVADSVVDRVLGPAERPKSVSLDTEVRDLVHHTMYDKWYKLLEIDGGTVVYSSNFGAGSQLNRFNAPSEGTYRIRLDVSAYQSDDPVLMQVQVGEITRSGSKRLVGFFEAPKEGRTVEIVEHLAKGDSIYPRPYGTTNNISGFLQKDYRREKLLEYPGAGLKIDRVRIEGPIDEWPPPSRARLLGGLDVATASAQDAGPLFETLLPRAFRRPVSTETTARYIDQVDRLMSQGRSFEESLRWTLRAMLCSAEFLFIDEPARPDQTIDDYALANRLSYFLWSSMPDDELMSLAAAGTLSEPAVLADQTERLLADPRSRALVTNFAEQWLDLREIDATSPDTKLYPDFDEYLQHSMVEETQQFVETVLRENLSIREFIDSRWLMLNERMARHYGFDEYADSLGVDFRRVPIPADSVRGGLMTQASVLKITANGANTSPVTRGVWMLENLMGIHPPPPPPNIPAVVPDVSGAQTLRQLLATHRSETSCNSCHRKIDPPGFALEEFDAIGAWRDEYQFQGSRRLLPVDSSGQTPAGDRFADVRQYKRLLMGEIDQVAKGLTDKLLTYATGRTMGFSDRRIVDGIVKQVGQSDYRFADLIHAVVQSPTFQQP